MLIARLIAEKASLETRLERASEVLAAKDMPVAMARMLRHEGDVLQMSLPDGEAAALRAVIEDVFVPDAALIVDHEPVVPKLFVSDMDSTMIQQECIDELADFAGLREQVSAITERAMRGEIAFEAALRERVALLTGLDESVIAHCLDDRIHTMPGARILVQTLKARATRTALITGGFHHFADPIAAQLGFDRVAANGLEVADGKLTGQLVGPVCDAQTKLTVLKEERASIANGRMLACGDGANDIPMLEAADYGFAFKPKPAARKAASGWVDKGDLTAILKLLDIPVQDWVME